jgi:hypothetical protein
METYYENRQLPQPVLPTLPQLELLKGQTALVTGANSGIGRAIALALGGAVSEAHTVRGVTTLVPECHCIKGRGLRIGSICSTPNLNIYSTSSLKSLFRLETHPEESRQSILRISLMLVLLLGAESGRWLEAELFVPDVSARVGNAAANAERARGQHQCRNRQRQRGFRPLPFHGD